MGAEWTKKDKATKQLKKALAALDTAVQKWYESNVPLDKSHYASCHIRSYPDGMHISNITLLLNRDKDEYIDIASSKEKYK